MDTALELTSDIVFLELIHRVVVCVFEAVCTFRGPLGKVISSQTEVYLPPSVLKKSSQDTEKVIFAYLNGLSALSTRIKGTQKMFKGSFLSGHNQLSKYITILCIYLSAGP